MPRYPMGPGFESSHHWWESGAALIPIVMFIILIGVVVWAVLRITSTNGRTSGGAWAGKADAALDEVRFRYARGEMSREEFVQRFRDLGGTGLETTMPPATTAMPQATTEPVVPPKSSPPDSSPPPAA